MRALCPLILLVLAMAAGCGDDAPPPRKTDRPPPELEVCPVEGTRFRPGHGIEAKVGDRSVLVCSPGCAFRLEIDPTILDGKDR